MVRTLSIVVAMTLSVGHGQTVVYEGPVSTPDEQARFLSGLRVPPNSVLAPLQQNAQYFEHGRTYAQTWRSFHEKYFSPMRQWAANEVTARVGNPRVVYYLFGGPDFINALALFPNAPVYILGGLEPVGGMVPPERLEWNRVLDGLANLRDSTDVTLKFSHFITKDMKVELERTDFRGVTPILMSFVALGGGEIKSVEITAVGGAPAVKIVFQRSGGPPSQTLYYVQADVSDSAFSSGGTLARWMAGFGPGVTYLKAASYLMHESYFSNVRNFLLSNSVAILQDDSGIPLRYFQNGSWQIFLYGSYTGTLDIFKKYVQPEMIQAYSGGAAPLPFGTGYKWRQGESNLMLAIKVASQ